MQPLVIERAPRLAWPAEPHVDRPGYKYVLFAPTCGTVQVYPLNSKQSSFFLPHIWTPGDCPR